MNNKKMVVIFLVLTITCSSALHVVNKLNPPEPDSIEDHIVTAIASNTPFLSNSGNPSIELESFDDHSNGWYLATIKPTQKTREFVPVFVILYKHNNTFSVVAGPDTHFTETEMLQYNVPDSIIKSLTSDEENNL